MALGYQADKPTKLPRACRAQFKAENRSSQPLLKTGSVGAGRLTPGWHSPPGVARADVRVVPAARGRGIGSALLDELQRRAEVLGVPTLDVEVRDDDSGSLAWTERHDFREIGRSVRLALDLTPIEEPAVDPPHGIEIVTWAEQPELARGIYDVACEAYPDEPGSGDVAMEPFEGWLSQDMQGSGDRADAVFVALAGHEVAGYAKLAMSVRPGYAMHDMTGVKRVNEGEPEITLSPEEQRLPIGGEEMQAGDLVASDMGQRVDGLLEDLVEVEGPAHRLRDRPENLEMTEQWRGRRARAVGHALPESKSGATEPR